jgi:hypothetical protein
VLLQLLLELEVQNANFYGSWVSLQASAPSSVIQSQAKLAKLLATPRELSSKLQILLFSITIEETWISLNFSNEKSGEPPSLAGCRGEVTNGMQLLPQSDGVPIGVFVGCGDRYLVTTLSIVPRGTEGAVSVTGTLAGLFASIFLALVGLAIHMVHLLFLAPFYFFHNNMFCLHPSSLALVGHAFNMVHPLLHLLF